MVEIAYFKDGVLHAGGCVGLRRDELERFAARLRSTDHVVLERRAIPLTSSTCCASTPRFAIANPLIVRLIAEARVETDKIDAPALAAHLIAPSPASGL